MNFFEKIRLWGDNHSRRWLCILRIFLGLFLVFMGLNFLFNIQMLPSQSGSFMVNLGIFHYVIFAHFVGGIFIAIGLLTRLADLVQIPILVGALFWINSPLELIPFEGTTELLILILILALSVLFLVFGSGKFSVEGNKKLHV